jgi:hypothetical protein
MVIMVPSFLVMAVPLPGDHFRNKVYDLHQQRAQIKGAPQTAFSQAYFETAQPGGLENQGIITAPGVLG